MNKKKRSINGNIVNQKIKIIQFNKGGSAIHKKINEIKDIILKEKPEILILNEFNLEQNIDPRNIQLKGYNLEHDQLIDRGVSRTGMYIKCNLNYSREKKYENDDESIITIKIGYPN